MRCEAPHRGQSPCHFPSFPCPSASEPMREGGPCKAKREASGHDPLVEAFQRGAMARLRRGTRVAKGVGFRTRWLVLRRFESCSLHSSSCPTLRTRCEGDPDPMGPSIRSRHPRFVDVAESKGGTKRRIPICHGSHVSPCTVRSGTCLHPPRAPGGVRGMNIQPPCWEGIYASGNTIQFRAPPINLLSTRNGVRPNAT